MSACTKKSFRPSLEALEDRCMPSTSPWAMLTQATLYNKVAEAALARIGTMIQTLDQNTLSQAALFSQRGDMTMAANPASGDLHTQPRPTQMIDWLLPKQWTDKSKGGLVIKNSSMTLGQILDDTPSWFGSRTDPRNFCISRYPDYRTPDYWIKFEYRVNDGAWRSTGKGEFTTTPIKTNPNFEKIDVNNKSWMPVAWKPGVSYDLQFRVTIMKGDHPATPIVKGDIISYTTDKIHVVYTNKALADGLANGAGLAGNPGQTQENGVLAQNQTNFANQLAASDPFFAALARTADQINNANANMASAQAGRTVLDGHETVDGFLMQARMNGWAHMSETGSPNASPFHHTTNGMAQPFGF